MYSTRAAKSRFPSVLALGLFAASATLAPTLVQAQAPNQPAGQPPATPGQPGGRQGRGGFGNFQARMPFATGQVTGGDPATGTIIISSPFGGSQTIHVTGDTKMVAMVQIDASKLKVGDTVQVQGVPNQITANTITAGELPDFLTAGLRGRGGPGGAGGNAPGAPPAAGGAAGGANAQPGRPQQQAFASATGKITSTEPLTIEISSEVSIVLKLGPNAKVSKLMPATINNVKLGDNVFAAGTASQDGTFAATGLGINVNAMGGMMGGRGFGGPGGGFGGPGGPGGPGGGFNGRGGRGGRRGGGQGGASGGNGQGGAGGGAN